MILEYTKSPHGPTTAGLWSNNTKELSLTDSSGAVRSVAIQADFIWLSLEGTAGQIAFLRFGDTPTARLSKDCPFVVGHVYQLAWVRGHTIAGIMRSGETATLNYHSVV